MSEPQSQPQAPRAKTARLGFLSAAGIVLALVVMGHGLGVLINAFPPYRGLHDLLRADAEGFKRGFDFSLWGARDYLTAVLLVALAAYVFVWRELIASFFRSMYVGVTLVAGSTLAVTLGVLVPQIDGFEDPTARVPLIADIDVAKVDEYLQSPKSRGDNFIGPHPEDHAALRGMTRDQVTRLKEYRQQFDAFRWAESYFFYHLAHGLTYGAFMPEAEIPPQAMQGLDRYERVYGKEERSNREKTMKASFASGPKTDEIEALMKRNYGLLKSSFDWCTTLDLNRTYKSHWFSALLVLLATAVGFNTFRGKPAKWFSIQKIGFVVTHVGMLVMLGGGWISNALTDRGILQLYLDKEPQDTYWQHYRSDRTQRMPFAVKLDRFARKEWKALQIEPLDRSFTSRPPRYTLWPGRTIQLDYAQAPDGEWKPQLELRVVDLFDHARVDSPKVTEDPSATDPLPVFELEVPNTERDRMLRERAGMTSSDGPTRQVLLSPRLRDQGYFDPERNFRLVASYGDDPLELFPRDEQTLGVLYVEKLGSSDPLGEPIEVRVGTSVQLEGGYTLSIVDATSDFRVGVDKDDGSTHPQPLGQQPDKFCAVWIDIKGPPSAEAPNGRTERRVVHEQVDAVEYGLQDRYLHRGLVTKLAWNRWTSPGPARFVLSWQEGSEPQLVAQDGTRTPASKGAQLALPGATKVVAKNFYRSAKFEKRILFEDTKVNAEGWDESFYSRDARGLVLDVVHFPGTDKEHVERIEMASTDTQQSNIWITGDHRFALRFLENTEGFPFDWRSVLSIVEKDAAGQPYTVPLGPESAREIRVNDYFKYKGYRFFQTNADPENPTYSGIGVVYDPGIPVVLAGMYTIILGTFLAFIVRPIVLARRKSQAPVGAQA
ncbi:MAG: hypothetical protein JNN27_06795 [Planctomycetes bacterium]|nr:hypothetical protein [Planctomycetota bacterium]